MSWLRRLFRDENGFTMVSVVTGMMVIGMFSLGAYTAALGDIQIGRKDQDRKIAEAAAKAGIEWYTFHLLRDTNYWTYCNDATKVVTPGISLQGMNRPESAWRDAPNGSDAQYQVELMTADNTSMTQDECKANPGAQMLDDGVLKIRSTGRSNGKQRQIVATYRRNSFLDYLYYTKWETPPPATYPATGTTYNSDWAKDNCDKPRSQRPSQCTAINFGGNDKTLGPMHTEDSSFLLCGTPQLGETVSDNIEVTLATSKSNAYTLNTNCGGSGTSDVVGTTIAPARSLDLPPSNASLENVATYVTTGQTCVQFNAGGTMTVWTNQNWSETITCTGTPQTYTLGLNTVLYAKNGTGTPGCSGGYTVLQRYNSPVTCGNLAVKGTYTGNVTLGAANDIIVTGDLKKPDVGDQMMGLIGQNFVRVYHPAINTSDQCSSSAGSDISQLNRIDAAILSLNSSFIVDNRECGANLGALTVNGNIAQKWRGPVGLVGGSGYDKDYRYDDRLKYRQPPQFLDPLKAAWHVLRQSEQSPVK